jgi:hypothetical protein
MSTVVVTHRGSALEMSTVWEPGLFEGVRGRLKTCGWPVSYGGERCCTRFRHPAPVPHATTPDYAAIRLWPAMDSMYTAMGVRYSSDWWGRS